MRGLFVVEMEALVGVPDAVDALVQGSPSLVASDRRRQAPSLIIGWTNRILRERVQDVGEHQFLMLLLVIEADLDQGRDGFEGVLARCAEEGHHGGVDMAAIGGDLLGAGPGHQAALGTRVPRTGADIIGIEQEGVVRVESFVARTMLGQQELFEEPGGMGTVPFGRACVRHRLDLLVLGGQGRGPALGLVAHAAIRIDEILRKGVRGARRIRTVAGCRGGSLGRHGRLRLEK